VSRRDIEGVRRRAHRRREVLRDARRRARVRSCRRNRISGTRRKPSKQERERRGRERHTDDGMGVAHGSPSLSRATVVSGWSCLREGGARHGACISAQMKGANAGAAPRTARGLARIAGSRHQASRALASRTRFATRGGARAFVPPKPHFRETPEAKREREREREREGTPHGRPACASLTARRRFRQRQWSAGGRACEKALPVVHRRVATPGVAPAHAK
jgi:hypothetical protein